VSTAELKATMACSFCLKSPGQVDKMIGGPGVFICNECVGLCNDILAQEGAKTEPTDDAVAKWQQRHRGVPCDESPGAEHQDRDADDQ